MTCQLTRIEIGQVGVVPGTIKMFSTDSLVTITTAGYINQNSVVGGIKSTDVIEGIYGFNGTTGYYGIFVPTFSNGVITLVSDNYDVELPTTANYMAAFSNTNGGLKNGASTITNPGNINAGLSGTAGAFTSFPSTASKGSLELFASNNSSNYGITITNQSFGQATDFTFGDPGSATGGILTCSGTPDGDGANIIWAQQSADSTQLASGGSVILRASSGSKTYKFVVLYLNPGVQNFSGGGGDRDIVITDGTTNFSVIPAATLQSQVNAAWGSTALPFPSGAGSRQPSAPGANIVIKYSGGTADYTTGAIFIYSYLMRA